MDPRDRGEGVEPSSEKAARESEEEARAAQAAQERETSELSALRRQVSETFAREVGGEAAWRGLEAHARQIEILAMVLPVVRRIIAKLHVGGDAAWRGPEAHAR